jgi:beta-lactam-binding protein with PASTA domain
MKRSFIALAAAAILATGCASSGTVASPPESTTAPLRTVPDVLPNYPGAAVRELREYGFGAEVDALPPVRRGDAGGNGYAVVSQSPRPGTRAPAGSDVRLVLGASSNGGGPWTFPATTPVPDAVGLPVESAYRTIADHGLLVTLRASKLPLHTLRVVRQSVAPGSVVRRSTVIVLTLG